MSVMSVGLLRTSHQTRCHKVKNLLHMTQGGEETIVTSWPVRNVNLERARVMLRANAPRPSPLEIFLPHYSGC